MKQLIRHLVLISLVIFIFGCENLPPEVTITSPRSGDIFISGDTIHLSVDCPDVDGITVQALYRFGGVFDTIITERPFTAKIPADRVLKHIMSGTTTLWAECEDDEGDFGWDTLTLYIGENSPYLLVNKTTYISKTSALLNGYLATNNSWYSYSEAGFYYGTDSKPEQNGTKVTSPYIQDLYSVKISPLEESTTYYVRAYAIVNGEKEYSQIGQFETLGEPNWITGFFTDNRDNKEYGWVEINGRKWMSENLAYLPEVGGDLSESIAEKSYWVGNYSGSSVEEAKATPFYEKYGVFYNYLATSDACPTGWRIPSDEDWKELEQALGMDEYSLDQRYDRGVDEGFKLKSDSLWQDDGIGSNEVGFNALPSGYADFVSTATGEGSITLYHAGESTTEGSFFTRTLSSEDGRISRETAQQMNFGISIRCVEDEITR